MTPAQMQLAKEARYNVRVAGIGLALFFGCMLVLPRDWFWFYTVPMAAFWFRYLNVRDKRDRALERMVESESPTPQCYAVEGGGIALLMTQDRL